MMNTQSSPTIVDMKVIPVAGHDSMLLNIGGAHSAWFTRNIVVLTDNAGNTGVGEALPSLYWDTPPDDLAGLVTADLDGLGHSVVEGALGALHGDGVIGLVDLHFHARGNDDGFSSNSRHCLMPLSYHTKASTSPPT